MRPNKTLLKAVFKTEIDGYPIDGHERDLPELERAFGWPKGGKTWRIYDIQGPLFLPVRAFIERRPEGNEAALCLIFNANAMGTTVRACKYAYDTFLSDMEPGNVTVLRYMRPDETHPPMLLYSTTDRPLPPAPLYADPILGRFKRLRVGDLFMTSATPLAVHLAATATTKMARNFDAVIRDLPNHIGPT